MSKKIKRSFILGDEWLYYKVYCGVHTSDLVLEELISPMTEKLFAEKLIHEWFFIRYNDPDPHLRLRFKLLNVKKIGLVIDIFNRYVLPYVQASLIWKIQTDTYTRELERYGARTMQFSEKLFFYDSKLIINALSTIKDEELYFLFILKCIDCFLTEFQLSRSEKLVFFKENALAFKKEFNIEKSTKRSLARKYRSVDENLQKIMGNYGVTEKYKSIENKLQKRNNALKLFAQKICNLNEKELLQVEFKYLLSSHIHMSVNRAFRDKQRFYELLVYDFLYRYYYQKYLKTNQLR